MKKYLSIAAASLLTATLFVGCGSSDNSTSSTTNTGHLVDSAVANVDYTCGNITGTTGTNGEFEYNTGDECTFSVGKVVIGKAKPEAGVKGAGFVTPLDLAGVTDATDITNPKVVEISQLLIGLDSDGDPTNGITINESIKSDLAKLDTTVELSADDVTIDTIISDLQTVNPDATIEVPTETEVTTHLENLDNAVQDIKNTLETTPDAGTNTALPGTDAGTDAALPGTDAGTNTATNEPVLPGMESTTTDTTTTDATAATDTTTADTTTATDAPVLPGMGSTTTDATTTDTTTTDTTATTNTTTDTTTGSSVVLPGM